METHVKIALLSRLSNMIFSLPPENLVRVDFGTVKRQVTKECVVLLHSKQGHAAGAGTERTTVVVAVLCGTQIEFDQVLVRGPAVALTEALQPVLGADAVLSTDGNDSYWTMAKESGVESGYFVSAFHGKGGNGIWHVQSVNRYDSSLKTGMIPFQGVSTKCHSNYIGWRSLLDRFKENLTPSNFCFMLFGIHTREGEHG